MRHLNYSHLLYFWTVAQEGSVRKASESLHLTPQTISGQIKLLEDSIGAPLLQRVGRGIALTQTGRLVHQYANEIFALGAELAKRVHSSEPGTPAVLSVGIVSTLPKLITHRTLEPVMQSGDGMTRLVCSEGELESLLADLAVHRLDLVLSDRPVPPGLNVKAYNHKLGTSEIGFFAHKSIAKKYGRRFPGSLDGAPLLLPVNTSALRRRLDDWFDKQGIRPVIIAEFDDSALLKAFGAASNGLYPAPMAIQDELMHMYHGRCVGEAEGLRENYYAISPERKINHPSVLRITESARRAVFD
ncbi:MAG: transcriptional activator NhaR [Gammaproteobacteria bacterium]|jgi:LysR family transcriptional activator of nhaA|nr:transcriptional activator NhaR [Gammaproteobacteria bacterium]